MSKKNLNEKNGKHGIEKENPKKIKKQNKNINKNIKKDKNDKKVKQTNFNEKVDNENKQYKNIDINTNNYEGKSDSKKRKKGNIVLKVILSILLVIMIVLGGILGRYIYLSGGNIKGAIIHMVKDVVGDQDPIFVLIMGVSEDISAELTDTIMLAGYNPDTNQAFVLSIPRDTFVGNNQSTAGGFDKINALYQKSPEKTVEAVEKLTGLNIDHYITVKTSALVEIVNSVGGVEFDVPINMDYDDTSQDLHIHLKAGKQVLNGDQAEQLVRFRHNNNGTTYSSSYGDNDEGRMRTQREFLKVLAQKVISWKNVDKINSIATAVFSNLETDMQLSKLLNYVPYAIEFNMENLSMEQLPGEPKKMNELWFYEADDEKIENLVNEYINKLGLNDSEKKKYVKQDNKSTNNKTTNNKNKTTNKTNDNSKNNTTNKNNTVNKGKTTNKTNVTNTTKNTVKTTTTKSDNNTTEENTTKNNTTPTNKTEDTNKNEAENNNNKNNSENQDKEDKNEDKTTNDDNTKKDDNKEGTETTGTEKTLN